MPPTKQRKGQNGAFKRAHESTDDEKPPKSPKRKNGKDPQQRAKSVESDHGPTAVGPLGIAQCCEIFEEHMGIKPELKAGSYTHLFRHTDIMNLTAFKVLLEEQGMNMKEIAETFRRYFSRATQPSVINIEKAVSVVHDYVKSGESVEMHPHWPSPPKSTYSLYIEENGIRRFDITEEQRADYNNHKQELQEQFKDVQREYVHKLETFLQEHDDLSPAHIDYVNEKIRTLRKKLFPKEPGSPQAKQKRTRKAKRKTAFDFYKMSKSSKYADLEAEERDRKLFKKFNKLSDEMKQIFLDLEQAQ
ncbi:hypothetical protein M3Y99_01184300 [Aphelenchoides fujianensis]|nr:hypothetical protein M3Y99_01184300 [Aphelenchoides fujianensis]